MVWTLKGPTPKFRVAAEQSMQACPLPLPRGSTRHGNGYFAALDDTHFVAQKSSFS